MKVVLRDDVENVGNKGDVVEVADGYARNFLVPRGLAMKATSGVVKQSESMRRNRAAKDARDKAAAEDLASSLASRTFTIAARAGEGGKLFGSITTADVAAAVAAQGGTELDRRKIELGEALKELGPAEVSVKLHPQVVATLKVEVVAEG
ncbi:MAG: 50S ribosomal protein L9 [Acidimicrobiia bacterium]